MWHVDDRVPGSTVDVLQLHIPAAAETTVFAVALAGGRPRRGRRCLSQRKEISDVILLAARGKFLEQATWADEKLALLDTAKGVHLQAMSSTQHADV